MKTYCIAKKIEFDSIKTLCAGESLSVSFDGVINRDYNYKLGVVGQVSVPEERRFEDVFAVYYRKLDDSLIKTSDGYALSFDEENFCHERTCYLMVKDGLKAGESYDFGICYKANGVKGNLKLSIEAYYGEKNTRYYYENADKTVQLNLEDSTDFTMIKKTVVFDKPVDFAMIKLSAVGFNGDACVCSPYLIFNGINYIKPFEPSRGFQDFDWVGEGFSLSERPKFSISVNGKKVFNGRKVETCDCFSGVEFTIPEGVLNQKNSVIEIGYAKENNLTYQIKAVRLIAMPKKFEVLGVDKTVPLYKNFGVLVYSDTGILPEVKTDGSVKFVGANGYKKGANVLLFKPKKLTDKAIVTILSGTTQKTLSVKVIDKRDDGVITGTGDAIYVPQDNADFLEYLSWYVTEGVGKLLTFRTNYRWGRNAECNDGFWKFAVPLLRDMGIYYSVMIDGRELNGCNGAPDKKLLESEYFLGEQTHEMDGSYTYWRQNIDDIQTETFYHALSRKIKKSGIYGKRSPVYDKNGMPKMFYAEDGASNMQDAYERLSENLKSTAEQGATRHTGVTPFFHTFLDVGYKWVGYESMYGTHELLFGAARGMSRSVGQSAFGAHVALQWSTMPLETKGHLLRYKISLNLSYMHGVTEINTEEGLWRFSNSYSEYDRFSKPCKEHLKIQREFNDFVTVNERKGKLKTNIAMIMGKYDGNECFSCGQVYGQKGEYWKKSKPEQSWDLLKVFYPRADLNAIYYYIVNGGVNSINAKDKAIMEILPGQYRDVIDDRPVGFYTETPYGAIDVISADCDNYSQYKFLFFTGWNTATSEQLKKLCKFVESGGTLMLAKPHLYGTVDRTDALSGKAKTIDCQYKDKLLSYVDSGRVIYFDKDEYPISYQEEYADALRVNAEKFGGQNVRKLNRVSYTEYQTENGSVIYLQNIGWWTKSPATCQVKINGKWQNVKLYGFDIKIIKV